MSSQLNVYLFSSYVLEELWLGHNLIPAPLIEDWMKDDDYSFCSTIASAVRRRHLFFLKTLFAKINFDYKVYSQSGKEFNMYFKNNVSDYIAHDDIFEQTLMSCAFVFQMCIACFFSGNNMFLEHSVPCWRNYFETSLKERFFALGGWEQLENCAFCYENEMINSDEFFKYLIYSDDLLNARHLIKFANTQYNMYDIFERFQLKIVEGKEHSCPICLPLFYAFSDICSKTKQTSEKLRTIEGYLQIFLRMFHSFEVANGNKITVDELMKKKFTESSNKPIDTEIPDLTGMQFSNDEINLLKQSLRDFLTQRLLLRIFINNANIYDTSEQCLFCGENCKSPVHTENSNEEYLINVIKTVIHETVNDSEGTFSDEKQTTVDSAQDISDDKCINDVLKLFLTLGIKPTTSKVFSDLNIKSPKKKNKKKLNKKSSQNIKHNNN